MISSTGNLVKSYILFRNSIATLRKQRPCGGVVCGVASSLSSSMLVIS
jgi:hypothetical protein